MLQLKLPLFGATLTPPTGCVCVGVDDGVMVVLLRRDVGDVVVMLLFEGGVLVMVW